MCKKNVKISTVHTALRSLKFTVKRGAFCPPARCTIGNRIFRVAWSLSMDEISNKKDVLVAYIDEAAVSINEGDKYGHAFIGITPLINCPLSNTKVSVLACVIPGFGVLYKYYGSSVLGCDYASFFEDVTNFLRKFVCSSNIQIVFIEDNCKIHNTIDVENIISKLKIAVIPTVPYSPALNGVVEGYFGYVKFKHVDSPQDNFDDPLKCDEQIIHEKWAAISDKDFTTKTTKKLYCQWKAHLAQCVQGLPLVSGHINASQYEKDAKRFKTIKVYRNHKETIYKSKK